MRIGFVSMAQSVHPSVQRNLRAARQMPRYAPIEGPFIVKAKGKIDWIWVLAIIASALLLGVVSWPSHAHYVMPPPVVTPPVVTPPPAPPPPAPAPAPAATGTTTPWLGIGVMVGVAVFFYLAICQEEEKRDPAQSKRLHCPTTPDWHVAPPFTTGP